MALSDPTDPMGDGSDLRRQAAVLRREARELLARTRLLPCLEGACGSVRLVGSLDMDLMTWRDIDLYLPVQRAAKTGFLALLAEISSLAEANGYCLVRARLNDEWAAPRGDYGSGYYWGLRLQTPEGESWKIDLWGWEPSVFSSKVAEHDRLKRALARCDRDLILRLKHDAMQQPGFRKTVTSWDVYRLVLDRSGAMDRDG